MLWVMTLLCRVRTVTNLYVEVPGVVLIMRNMDPGVVGDDPLMQGEDSLVTRFDPTHLSSQARNKFYIFSL